MKQCIKCLIHKDVADFGIRTDTGRLRNVCKSCRLEQINKWQEENREQTRTNQRRYITTPRNRAISLFNSAKIRARKKGEEFKLTLEDVAIGISVGYCVKTSIQFDYEMDYRHANKLSNNPFSPSIDKIDPHGIYEPENVQYVSTWYNFAKGQTSEKFLIEMCKKLLENLS